jgi:hypothetical protein
MVSPVPKHLRTEAECERISPSFVDHVVDVVIDDAAPRKGAGAHRAKYAPGLASKLVEIGGSTDVGDPMCGTGTLAHETGLTAALNDIDPGMMRFLEPLAATCEITIGPAHSIPWSREVCIFSPPYYPRTDRRRPNAHDDEKRGAFVGFRDSYACDKPEFIGNPGGANAILTYRTQMTEVYRHLASRCSRMVTVTKNWTRLGTELRLDLDTILMAQEVGWTLTGRHGWTPRPSLWSRYNANRGGGVQVEDILVFTRAPTAGLFV